MTYEEVKELKPGDRVFWADPDRGACSRWYEIDKIMVRAELVMIKEPDGSYLDCYPEELILKGE
jgi:hypothetical protein